MDALQDSHTFPNVKELDKFCAFHFYQDGNLVLRQKRCNLIFSLNIIDGTLAPLKLTFDYFAAIPNLNFEFFLIQDGFQDSVVF